MKYFVDFLKLLTIGQMLVNFSEFLFLCTLLFLIVLQKSPPDRCSPGIP